MPSNIGERSGPVDARAATSADSRSTPRSSETLCPMNHCSRTYGTSAHLSLSSKRCGEVAVSRRELTVRSVLFFAVAVVSVGACAASPAAATRSANGAGGQDGSNGHSASSNDGGPDPLSSEPDPCGSITTPAASGPAPIGMVAIPGGSFQAGLPRNHYSDRHLSLSRCTRVAPFLIDRTEVTVGEYLECVRKGRCAPAVRSCPGAQSLCTSVDPAKYGAFPVNCVAFQQARDFCEWAGKRLPSEEEWEYAARGPKSNLYPWGSSAPSQRVCWGGATGVICPEGLACHGGHPCAVGSSADDVSEFGVLDLGGSLSEFTTPGFETDTARVHEVLRGGNWMSMDPELEIAAARRSEGCSDCGQPVWGIRCAR